ncbi:nucleotide exchange factor GrpE [bacterium 1XD42-54]|nr:nucleotide exchange factor GrpE [bacterium 1XD42-54]
MEQPVEENRQEEILEEAAAQADAAEAEEVIDDTQETEESAASEMEEMQEDSEEQDDQKKRSLFGKKKKDKRDVQIEELTDRVQRQMAEFDNFRKRSEKEKAAMYEVGAKSVIEKILPTIDNFERGFVGLTEEQKEDAFVQGMEKVYRQMLTTLESIGVTPIEALGKEFDPNFHNAVMHVEDDEAGENIIVEEFQKGYLYRDSIVRHSMVKVAN